MTSATVIFTTTCESNRTDVLDENRYETGQKFNRM